jgi:hypothetical protein
VVPAQAVVTDRRRASPTGTPRGLAARRGSEGMPFVQTGAAPALWLEPIGGRGRPRTSVREASGPGARRHRGLLVAQEAAQQERGAGGRGGLEPHRGQAIGPLSRASSASSACSIVSTKATPSASDRPSRLPLRHQPKSVAIVNIASQTVQPAQPVDGLVRRETNQCPARVSA